VAKRKNNIVIKDVAERAGVSVATVSRALSGQPHVRPEVQRRVQEAAEALGYVPDRSARSLRLQRSHIVGLIVPDIENAFFTSVARAVEDEARKHNLAVFLCNSDEDAQKEQLYLRLLQAEKVVGIILAPTQDDARMYEETDKHLPIVAIDRTIPGADLDSITTNNTEAAKQLVNLLIGQGHQRIAALLADQRITTARARYDGYVDALHCAGLPFDETLVRSGRPIVQEGHALTHDLFKDPKTRPSALFTATKLMTLGAIRALTELGLRVPDDVAIAAYDSPGYLPINTPEFIAEQPTYDIGAKAMALLLERIEAPHRPRRRVVLTSQIR
jgi:LacI family fructose operon transcriptional repressor